MRSTVHIIGILSDDGFVILYKIDEKGILKIDQMETVVDIIGPHKVLRLADFTFAVENGKPVLVLAEKMGRFRAYDISIE